MLSVLRNLQGKEVSDPEDFMNLLNKASTLWLIKKKVWRSMVRWGEHSSHPRVLSELEEKSLFSLEEDYVFLPGCKRLLSCLIPCFFQGSGC